MTGDSDGDLLAEVDYENRDRDVIMSLVELIDDYHGENEEDD